MNLLVETDSDFYNDVLDTYREYRGRDTSEAEIEFLNICASLPFYGIHRFQVLVYILFFKSLSNNVHNLIYVLYLYK